MPDGSWEGSGLQFQQIDRNETRNLLLTSSEAELDIEYWIRGPSLFVTQRTFDPGADGPVPWVTHSFNCEHVPAQHSIKLLFRPPLSDGSTVASVASELASLPVSRAEDAELFLFQLRNVGCAAPRLTLRALQSLSHLPWYDGANAEVAAGIRRELELLAAFW
jgi:hypothetical protein